MGKILKNIIGASLIGLGATTAGLLGVQMVNHESNYINQIHRTNPELKRLNAAYVQLNNTSAYMNYGSFPDPFRMSDPQNVEDNNKQILSASDEIRSITSTNPQVTRAYSEIIRARYRQVLEGLGIFLTGLPMAMGRRLIRKQATS